MTLPVWSIASNAALPIAYGKLKKQYEKRMGKEFQLKQDETKAAE